MKTFILVNTQVNAGDSRGRTALHCAAQRGAVGVLQVLLNHSADPNIQDKRGTTALLLLGGSFLMRGHRRAIGYIFLTFILSF